jgi:hypothetical protein
MVLLVSILQDREAAEVAMDQAVEEVLGSS